MAYTISVCDTHRIPYPNATAKAYKLGSAMQTTDQIKFKHGKNGPEIGFELKTNARGYFCDNNGDLYTNGVFVTEDAIIKITMADGTSTTWEVAGENDTPINDGKLYGTRTKDSADDDIVQKWSANSPNNYTLDYDDLIHKPRINEWMEVEQVVTIDNPDGTGTDTVNVDKYCKTMTVLAKNGVGPVGWSFDGENWSVSDSSAPNSPWALKLIADTDRVAQVISVRNLTPWRLAIKNSLGEVVTVLDPTNIADGGKFVAMYGDTDQNKPYRATVNIEKTGDDHVCVFKGGVQQNDSTHPIIINDYSPDTLEIKFESTYNFYPANLYLKSGVTKSRVIRLWLRNYKTNEGLHILDAGNGNAYIATMATLTIVELIVTPDGLVKLSEYLRTQGSTLVIDGSNSQVLSQNLPPEATFILGNVSDHYTVSASDDVYTEKMIYGVITNTSSVTRNLTLRIGVHDITMPLLPLVANSFVIHKQGTEYCIIKPTNRTVENKYFKLTASGNDDPDYAYKVTRTVSTQDTININIPYLMQLQSMNWNTFGDGSERACLVFDLSDILAVNASITLHFKVDAYMVCSGSDYEEAVICFGTIDNFDANTNIPLSETHVNNSLCISRKNIVATVTRTPTGYTISSFGVEDTQE